MNPWDVRHGDCRELMAAMEPDSVDAVVTDPPYGLEFMGAEWDRLDGAVLKHATERGGFQDGPSGGNPYSRSRVEYGRSSPQAMQAWHEAWAREALRVLKPGGHLLAFSGTRTSHRLTCALEDAGFEIRDTVAWLYGSGFPKSRDVAKDLDRMAGVSREDKFEGAIEQGDAGPGGNRDARRARGRLAVRVARGRRAAPAQRCPVDTSPRAGVASGTEKAMAKPDDDAIVVMATIEVARAFDPPLSPSMVRKYAHRGRLKPFAITLSGQRLYEAREVKRLADELGRKFHVPEVKTRKSPARRSA